MRNIGICFLAMALAAGVWAPQANAATITYTTTVVTPSADSTVALAGQQLTYVFKTQNTSATTSPTSFVFAVPTGTTFVSLTPDSTITNGTWVLTGTLPAVGGTGTITYTNAAFTAGATTANWTLVVNVSATQPTGSNNTSFTATATATGTNTGSGAATRLVSTDLFTIAIGTPSADGTVGVAGANLSYTFTATNGQTGATAGVAATASVTMTTPVGTTFASVGTTPAGWSVSALPTVGTTGSVTYTNATLAANTPAVFTFGVTINAGQAAGTNNISFAPTFANTGPNGGSVTATRLVSTDALTVTVGTPSANGTVALAGQNISYTFTAANATGGTTTPVSLAFAIPTGTTFQSIVAPGGNWILSGSLPTVGGTGTITYTNATFTAGSSSNFTLVVNENAGQAAGVNNISFTATLTNTGANGGANSVTRTISTDKFTVSVTTPSADGTVGVAGANVSYAFSLTSVLNGSATSASVSFAVPTGTNFQSVTPAAGWTLSGSLPAVGGTGTITYTNASFAPGSTSNFTFVVQINAALAVGTNNISFTPTLTNTGVNGGSASATRLIGVDGLSINITTPSADGTNATAGTNETYVFTVSNTAGGTATPASISIPIPTGTTYVSFSSASGWLLSGSLPTVGGTGTITYTNTSLAAGSTSTNFTLTVKVNASQAAGTNNLSFQPTVSATSPNTGSLTVTRLATTVLSSDMSVSLAGATTINPGSFRAMTITYTNLGPSDSPASNVLSLPIPNGVTIGNVIASGSVTPSFTGSNGNGTFFIIYNAIPAGTTLTITYNESIPSNTAAGIMYTDQWTTGSGANPPTPDPVPGNNVSAAITATSVIASDVAVAYSNIVGTTAGQNRSFTITVTNNGPSDATNVLLTQNPATGASFVSFTQSGSAPTFTAIGNNQFSISTLAPNATKTFTFTELIGAGTSGTLTDTATVTVNADNANDPNTTNNTALSQATLGASADLTLTMSGAVTTPTTAGFVAIGDTVTYTLSLGNLGPSAAANTVVQSTIPANATFVSATKLTDSAGVFPSTFTNAGGFVKFTSTSPFPVSATATFQIVYRVNQGTTSGVAFLHSASATSSAGDTNSGNNSPSTSFTTKIVEDLAIVITSPAANSTVGNGANLTYTMTLTNNGPTNATDVLFSTATPTNTTFVSISASPAAFTFSNVPAVGGTGTVASSGTSLASIAAGTTVTITFVVKVNQGLAANTAISLSASVNPQTAANDLNTGNNTATVTVNTFINSDIAVTGLVSNPTTTVTPPSTVTYNFNVVDQGPSNATGVVLTDTLPTGVTFVSLTANGASVTPTVSNGVITYNIGAMNSGQTIAFVLTTTFGSGVAGPTATNTVSASSTTADLDNTNNSKTSTLTVMFVSDLVIAVSPSSNPIIAGNQIQYVVTVANNGPSDAKNVTLTFPFPNNTIFQLVQPATGWTTTSTNNAGDTSGTYTATIATFPAIPQTGSSSTFTFTFQVDPTDTSTPLVNTAMVASTSTDNNLGNNSAMTSVMVTPQPTVSVNSISVPEGNSGVTNATFTVMLSAANTQVSSIDYITVDGTAKIPADYVNQAGTITFLAGETSHTITVPVNGNTLVEPDKKFSIHLTNGFNTSVAQNDGVCTITNDDVGGKIQFSAANFNFNENAGNALVTVTRTGGIASNISVNYATSDGTAVAGVDYTATTGTLTFAAGVTSLPVMVPLLNKYGAIADATFTLTLSAPNSGPQSANSAPAALATLGAQTTTTVTILSAPAFISPLNVNAQIGSQFSYTLIAIGEAPLTYSLPNPAALPPGLSFAAGYITGIPTVIGSYSVPIRADNAIGFDVQTLIINVTPIPVPPGASNTLKDSDGDGFPDELELFIGSNPFDANSTPFSTTHGLPQGMKNLKLAISLNFAKAGSDSITMSGSATLPADFAQSGKVVVFDIGGVIRRFALDANGVSTVGTDTAKFKLPKSAVAGTTISTSFTLSIRNAKAAELLTDEGLTNSNASRAPVIVPVVMLFNSTVYTTQLNQVYSAKAGRTGRSRNP